MAVHLWQKQFYNIDPRATTRAGVVKKNLRNFLLILFGQSQMVGGGLIELLLSSFLTCQRFSSNFLPTVDWCNSFRPKNCSPEADPFNRKQSVNLHRGHFSALLLIENLEQPIRMLYRIGPWFKSDTVVSQVLPIHILVGGTN